MKNEKVLEIQIIEHLLYIQIFSLEANFIYFSRKVNMKILKFSDKRIIFLLSSKFEFVFWWKKMVFIFETFKIFSHFFNLRFVHVLFEIEICYCFYIKKEFWDMFLTLWKTKCRNLNLFFPKFKMAIFKISVFSSKNSNFH